MCACVCKPSLYCKHGSTSRFLCRWGWWVFLPASAGWAGWLPETSSWCSIRFPIVKPPKNHHKPLRSLARKQRKSVCCFSVVRFRPCSKNQGQQLPVLHPPSPCFFRSQGSGAVLIFTRLSCCVHVSTLIADLATHFYKVFTRLGVRLLQAHLYLLEFSFI